MTVTSALSVHSVAATSGVIMLLVKQNQTVNMNTI